MNSIFSRNIAVFLLALSLLFAFTACSQAGIDDHPDLGQSANPNVTGPFSDETIPTSEARETDSKNIMRADALNAYSDAYVLGGNAITREAVTSVTFLDTLANMPDTAWDVSAAQDRSVMAWVENGSNLFIAGEGGVTAGSCRGLFCNYLNVTSIRFNGCFDTSVVTDMCDMFANCWNLTEVDVETLDTGNVGNMTNLFYYCSSLSKLELSGWDVSNVNEAKMMFYHCPNLTDIGCTLDLPSGCQIDDMYKDSGLQ